MLVRRVTAVGVGVGTAARGGDRALLLGSLLLLLNVRHGAQAARPLPVYRGGVLIVVHLQAGQRTQQIKALPGIATSGGVGRAAATATGGHIGSSRLRRSR